MRAKCECSDRGCPAHKGCPECGHDAVTVLYRVDMDDPTGTPMCEACAEDATESGLYSYRPVGGDEDDE